MSGLCGILYHEPDRSASPELLTNMCRAIRHRGPDAQGEKVLDNAAQRVDGSPLTDLFPEQGEIGFNHLAQILQQGG